MHSSAKDDILFMHFILISYFFLEQSEHVTAQKMNTVDTVDICTDIEWVMWSEWKEAMSFDGNENNKPNEFKDAQKTKVKIFCEVSPFWWNLMAPTQNGIQSSVWTSCACMPPWQCLGVFLTRGWRVYRGILSQIWRRASLTSSAVWGKNVVASDGLKHNVPELFCWI